MLLGEEGDCSLVVSFFPKDPDLKRCKELLVSKLTAQVTHGTMKFSPSVTSAAARKLSFSKRPTGDVEQSTQHFDIWSGLKELPKISDTSTVTPSDTVTIQRMVEDYFHDTVQVGMLQSAFFSFQYSKEIWRPLYKLALHYLSCPPSSVYSERVFSTAGNLVTNRRRRLLPQNVEEMMFIKMNWKFHEEDFSRQLHYSTETFGIVDSSGDELILCEDDAHTDEDVNDDNILPL